MIHFDHQGIYCAPADVYIDPWQPVKRAIITHGHSDHSRSGHGAYLAHRLTAPVIRHRLGEISVQQVEYGEQVNINGVHISLHPAGHIPGSAQVRLEYKGEIWVASGDYKLQPDDISTPFEPVACHHFITESTFGLPIFKFPDPQDVYQKINDWWLENKQAGRTSIILGYTLGKAQHILNHLDKSIGPIFTHGAVHNMTEVFREMGISLPAAERVDPSNKRKYTGAIIIAPPSAQGTTWLKRFEPYAIAICSGWMQLRGTRRRKGVDRGFVLSDHADWPGLNQAIDATGAQHVHVTHGYRATFARWLQESKGINTSVVEASYKGESIDGQVEEDLVQGAGGAA